MNALATERKAHHHDPRVAFFDHHAHRWDNKPDQQAYMLGRLANLRERLGLRPGLRVLEVGCGTGLITGWLAGAVAPGRVMAVDFSSAMLAQAKTKGIAAEFRQLDICLQAPPEGAFDLVLCFQSFPHFRDPTMALRHMAGSLNSQRRLVVLHLVGSEQINTYHRHVGGAVGTDLLPLPPQWPALLRAAGLRLQSLEDRPDLFLLQAERI